MGDDTRLCERCGIVFVVTRPTKRFCSEQCRHRAGKRRRVARRRAGGVLPGTYSDYVPKVPVAAACEACGVEYLSTYSWQKYCSPTCKRRVKERQKRERRKDTLCVVAGCTDAGVRSSGLCEMHYSRRQRGIPFSLTKRPYVGRRQSETCTAPGCGKPTYWTELCKRHYLEAKVREGKDWAVLEYESPDARKKTELYGGVFTVVNRFELFNRDGWVCQLCGEPVDPELKRPNVMAPTIDHIAPLSLGGDHTMENCQLAHLSCNSSKGNRWVA